VRKNEIQHFSNIIAMTLLTNACHALKENDRGISITLKDMDIVIDELPKSSHQ